MCMKEIIMRELVAVGILACAGFPAVAQQVEKVADFTFNSVDGVGYGGYAPLDRFTQVETNLWFTTSKGGTFDAGTISRFDLVSRQVVQVASFDNNSGKASESWLLPIGDQGYFTAVSGGAGNKGTLARVDLNTGVFTTLYDFPTNSATGASPRAGLTRIGDELWTLTSLGGTSNRGTMVRYNLTNGVTTVVTNFDGPVLGGQPFGGLVPGGSNTWYFTTFTGGNTFATAGLPLGAGTLGRLTFDGQGNPVITRLVDLTAGYPQFPGLEPVLVGTNSLYFGTTGPNATPGAIIRYDLDTGTWTNLYSFSSSSGPTLQYGNRPGYSGMVEWLGELYFINRQGGTSNLGTVVKFNLASNTVSKLADLEGAGGNTLGSASGCFGSGCLVEETNRFYIYYPLTSGGVNNRGTIIRVVLPPPPIVTTLTGGTNPGELTLSWTGGYPPFTVQGYTNAVGGGWTNLLEDVTNRSVTLPMAADTGFLRLKGSQ